MSYVFPASFDGGYSGPFHDYYLYGDFDGALPTSGSGGAVKALITGVNPNSALSNISTDLTALALKTRKFNNHVFNSNQRGYVETRGGTANYSSHTSWNCGVLSTVLISRQHIMQTQHGRHNWNTDMGYGVGAGGGSIYQFIDRDGITFNVEVEQGPITGTGAVFGVFAGVGVDSSVGITQSDSAPLRAPYGSDVIIFKLTERIPDSRNIQIANRFYKTNTNDSSNPVIINSNGIMRFFKTNPSGVPVVAQDRFNTPLNEPTLKFPGDSGSPTFYNHKTEGTIWSTVFDAGMDIMLDSMYLQINSFLVSEGEETLNILEKDDLSTSNGGFYDYTDYNLPSLGTDRSFTPNSFDNNRKVKVTIVGTRADGTKTKPFTKEIQIAATGNIPPNFTNLSDPVESNLNFSNSLYCSPGTDGSEIISNYGSYYLGFSTDEHPKDTDLYGVFGVTNTCQLDVSYGNTLDSEFSQTVLAIDTQNDSSGGVLQNNGGSNFVEFKGMATGIVFPSEVAGQTVYVRPRIENELGITQGDWYELGRAITAGRGSTFTSFSFDNYGPTAGATMIGTAAGYTAIPEIGRNKIQNLFGLGGLTVADIQINGTSYVSGITFSGPTFALKIPSDCPEGASLGILNISSIEYANPYIIDGVGVTFLGELSGVTYINVGGS